MPPPLLPHLRVGVLDEEVHQCHDEDGDGHPEVPNQPPGLWGHHNCVKPTCVPPPAEEPSPLCPHQQQAPGRPLQVHGLSLHVLSQPLSGNHIHQTPSVPSGFVTSELPHLAGQEGTVLELAEEEGQEEGASHEHEGQQSRVGLWHLGLVRGLHVIHSLQWVVLEDLGREGEKVRRDGIPLHPSCHAGSLVAPSWWVQDDQ